MSKPKEQRIAQYKLMHHLGNGSLGEIYQAHDEKTDKMVAIKVLSAYLSRLTEFRSRFIAAEAKTARLDHPAIIDVHHFGQYEEAGIKDEQLYVVMDLTTGPSLAKALAYLKRTQRWLPPSEAIQIVRHICMAVEYVNRLKALRREYSPAKIILTHGSSDTLPHYQPMLTDLGLKTLLGSERFSQTSIVRHSLIYVSPEALAGGEADERSDVFSLGVLLYELLTGSPPYIIDQRAERVYRHIDGPNALQKGMADVPSTVQKIVRKALSKDPDERYGTPGDIAAELGEYIRDATAADKAFLDGRELKGKELKGKESVSLHNIVNELRVASPSASRVVRRPSSSPGTNGLPANTVLSIKKPDGTTQTVPLKKPTVTVGRALDNDLILQNDGKLSRYHAKIQKLADGHRITDLNSGNGIKLNGKKIPHEKAMAWRIGESIQIGEHMLTLESKPMRNNAASNGHDPVDGQISVTTKQTLYTVAPGHSTQISVDISNLSTQVAHFDLNIEGIPRPWWAVNDSLSELMPGDSATIQVMITPPLSPESKAQEYPLRIRAASQRTTGLGAETTAKLIVSPFYQFEATLHPTRLRTRRAAKVTIENKGNLTQSFSLSWQDDSGMLRYEPPDGKITIQGGDTGVVPFRAYSTERRIYGPDESYALTVNVAPTQQPDQPKVLRANVRSGAWISKTLIVSVGLLIASIFGLQRMTIPSVTAKVTPENPKAGESVAIDVNTKYIRDLELYVNETPEPISTAEMKMIIAGTPYTLTTDLQAAAGTPEVAVRGKGWFPLSEVTAIAPIVFDPSAPIINSFEVARTEFTLGGDGTVQFSWDVENAAQATLKRVAEDGSVDEKSDLDVQTGKYPTEIPSKPGSYTYRATFSNEDDKETPSEEKTISVIDPILTLKSDANFRTGNSQEHELIKRMKAGTQLRALAKPDDNGWINAESVSDVAQTGWIFIDLVSYEANLEDLPLALETNIAAVPTATPTATPPPTDTPVPAAPATPVVIIVPGPSTGGGADTLGVGSSGSGGPGPGNSVPNDSPPPAPPPPAEPPRQIDGRLEQLGVRIDEAAVSSGTYWRLVEAKWESEAEAGGRHNIYVTTLDEAGERKAGVSVKVSWSSGSDDAGVTEDKQNPGFEDKYSTYMYNFPMYAAGQSYDVKINDGLPSDALIGAGLGSIEERGLKVHTVFILTFQQTTK